MESQPAPAPRLCLTPTPAHLIKYIHVIGPQGVSLLDMAPVVGFPRDVHHGPERGPCLVGQARRRPRSWSSPRRPLGYPLPSSLS